MDGVLVDSEQYWPEVADEMVFARAVKKDGPVEAELAGLNRNNIYDLLAEKYGVFVSREKFLDLYDSAAEVVYGRKVSLDSDAESVLMDLSNAEIPCAIASSAPTGWIDAVVERFDLGRHFTEVVSAEAIDAPGKPHPGVYERTCSRLGVENGSCIVVEDSEHGAKAARRAGTNVVGFATGEQSPPTTPQRRIGSLREISGFIQKN